MKKIAFIALLSVSVLTIAGCGRTRTQKGKLPSGGTEVDIYSEEGQNKLMDIKSAVADKYSENLLDSFGIDASISDVNYRVSLDNFNAANTFVSPMSASIGMENLGANLSFKAAKNSEGNVDASLTLDNVKGSCKIQANVPDFNGNPGDNHNPLKINSSLDFSGAKAAAYYQGEYVFIDASGLDGLVSKAESFANEIMDDLNQSFVAPYLPAEILSFLDGDGHLPLSQYWDSLFKDAPNKKMALYAGVTEWFSEEDQAALVSALRDVDIVSLLDSANEVGINTSMVVYKEGTFGFELSIDKEVLLSAVSGLINSISGGEAPAYIFDIISESVNKFDVSLAIYFEDYLLTNVSLGVDVLVSASDLSQFVPAESRAEVGITGSASISLSGAISADINYQNVKVSFPNFSDYVVVESDSFEDALDDLEIGELF